MNATLHFLTVGTVPLGSFTGGVLGEILGLRLAIGVAAYWILILSATSRPKVIRKNVGEKLNLNASR